MKVMMHLDVDFRLIVQSSALKSQFYRSTANFAPTLRPTEVFITMSPAKNRYHQKKKRFSDA